MTPPVGNPGVVTAFDLPWPWDGERFELGAMRTLTYITGPLGSGKTRLAMMLAQHLSDAAFLGLDRLEPDNAATPMERDPGLRDRVERTLVLLEDQGATRSGALIALLAALESGSPKILVIDMVEQGLDEATQAAVIAHLRDQRRPDRPLFMLTRSTSILRLESLGPDEAIIFCPANYSPPMHVKPHPGSPGYESVATCLVSPAVRARTSGLVAVQT